MKKLILFTLSMLLVIGCSKHEFTEYNVQELKEKNFKADFDNTFGVSPSVYANHQWGMETVPLIEVSASTRAADPKGNMWEDNGYTVPDDISNAEREAVKEVFKQKGEASYTSLVDWDCFFVQQVWKGESEYTAGNGGNVKGSDHMDWLCTETDKKIEVVCWWPYEERVTKVPLYPDHIFDFNDSNSDDYGGRMLMYESNTNRFGYHNSEDSQVHYYFRMEKIEPYGYFVGFDFSGEGNNPNQQIQRDYIYNDWIVKIVPGKGTTPSVDRVRIMCEDLGSNTSDFDYNDIVFDIRFIKNGGKLYADIIIRAAGGTLPLTIGGLEVHSLFGVSTGTMVNTYHGKHNEKEPISLTIELNGTYTSAWEAINSLPIIVKNPNGEVIQLTVNPGSPAEMIAVPVTTEWSDERVPIQNSYPAFVDWIRDSSVKWWTEE